MSSFCTSDESEKLLAYLRYAFGGYPVSDLEAHAYGVVFRSVTKSDARRAIEALLLVADHRPSPSEIAVRLRLMRREARCDPTTEAEPDPTPELAGRRIAEIRETLDRTAAR